MILLSPSRIKVSPLVLLLAVLLLPVILICVILLFLFGFVLMTLFTLYAKITGKTPSRASSFYDVAGRYKKYRQSSVEEAYGGSSAAPHSPSASARITDAEFEVIQEERKS